MSSLTNADIAVKIRRRMNAPVSERLRYAPLIDDALLLLSREAVGDKDRRQLFLTDKSVVTVALDVNGVGDIAPLIASQRILIDRLGYGEIFDPSNPNPLVQRQQNTRPGNWDHIYLHYNLDGTKLRTQSSDNNATPLLGPLSLAVPKWVTLAELAEQEVDRLVEKGIELLIESHSDYEKEGDDE